MTTQARAFTLVTTNPNQRGWANNEISLLVNMANCPIDVVSLISDAAAVWNDVANSNIKVSYGGSTASTAYANPTTVYCATNFAAVTGADDDFVPGAASVHTSNNVIYEGIIYLNASTGNANISNFDRNALKIIMAHEIGHLLGLGHSSSQNALMYYDATYRNVLSLSQDDIDGISYLYPSDELSGDKMLGCGHIGHLRPPSPPSSQASLVLAILLVLPMAVSMRLRRSKKKLIET